MTPAGGTPGVLELTLLAPAAGILLILVLLWAVDAVRRQVRLLRMQRWAAWYWRMNREEAPGGHFRAQAEHLDRHIRLARDGEPTDPE